MNQIPVSALDPRYEKAIRTSLRVMPVWLIQGARISKVVATGDPAVREQVSMYQHGTRILFVSEGLGVQALRQSMGHELGHGIDDLSDMPEPLKHPHYFSSTEVWFRIHRSRSSFEFPKYAEKPLEYFADCVAKFSLLGKDRFSATHPREAIYINSWVVPLINQVLAR